MPMKSDIFDLSGEYGVAYDTKGNAFYFDHDDYDAIKQFYWYCHPLGYVLSWINGKTVRLHRFIMNCPITKEVDHINNNRRDCRKQNLRICTRQENQYNQPLQRSNTSGYKGVDFHSRVGKWRARIRANGKRIELGHYRNPEDAYIAYCRASKAYHGEFGNVGTPPGK